MAQSDGDDAGSIIWGVATRFEDLKEVATRSQELKEVATRIEVIEEELSRTIGSGKSQKSSFVRGRKSDPFKDP